MSVDPLIQGIGNSQGLNPYSYVMNNPLAFVDPTGYATEVKEEKIKVAQIGSRIKRTVGTKTTTTVTDDNTGEVTNQHSVSSYNDGSYSGVSVSYSNGSATSATAFKGNSEGDSISATVDIGSQKEIAKEGNSQGTDSGDIKLRSVSATDSDGNIYSWKAQQMWPGSPTSMEGAMRGAHNIGQGYKDWADAGGSSSAMDHPLVMIGMSFAGDALVAMRFGVSKVPYLNKVDAYFQKQIGIIREQYSKLIGKDRRSFQSQFVSGVCGIMLSCAAKHAPQHLAPYLPKNPPAFNNGVNYLHRWHDKSVPYPLRTIEKVE